MGKAIISKYYKVDFDKLMELELNKTEAENERAFKNKVEAIRDAIRSHEYWLSNEEYKVRKRKEVIKGLKNLLNKEVKNLLNMGQ